jgi:hypothetical protein
MNGSFAFVETLSGVAAARAAQCTHIASDNPLLANDPKAGRSVSDISLYLHQNEATELGRGAINILLALDALLTQKEAAQRYGGRPGPLNLTMAMRALTTTLLQRGVMLQRALAEFGTGPLRLFAAEQPRWLKGAPWNMPRFACPHRVLAEAGFFDNRPVEFVPVDLKVSADFNDTATDDFWLRVFLVPPPVALFELMRRAGLAGSNGKGRVAIGKTSESLAETLPWLAVRGLRFKRFDVPAYPGPPPPPFGSACRADAWLEEKVTSFLAEKIGALAQFPEHAARAVAGVIILHLSAGLSALGDARRAIDAAVERTFAGSAKPRILMTSGVYGPVGRQLHGACREHEVTLIDFEHGTTTGIAHTTERRLQVSEATTCDMLMACSPRAARSFRKAPSDGCDIRVVGLADQTRSVLFRPLQRARARRRLKVSGSGTTVVHVSGLLYGGNMRSGDDNSVESYVFSTERALLCDVYGAVNKTVLYKPYPTQRFPHDVRYDELFVLPQNVRLIDRADFRYIRAAADIIVTNANQSTLGWCAGADVPMVCLRSRMVQDLVDDELNAEISDCFFVVDVDRSDWPQVLTGLLNRGIADLRDEWLAKAARRSRFLREAMFGPPGSVGRRAARIVSAIHG